jgi:hypothetical protein
MCNFSTEVVPAGQYHSVNGGIEETDREHLRTLLVTGDPGKDLIISVDLIL